MILSGQRALITGCRGGIGSAAVRAFAREGAHVIAHARKQDDAFERELCEISRVTGSQVEPVYFDLTNSDEMKHEVTELFRSVRSINILVNNAGTLGENSLFFMTSASAMREVFDVNFFGAMELIQMVGRKMMKTGGSIVNIASVAGIDGDPGQLEYSASKAALICATKKLANDLGQYQIRVNAIAPGLTETDMLHAMSPDVKNATLSKMALKRVADPAEIADAVVFLASNKSRFITGQVLRVDGGLQ